MRIYIGSICYPYTTICDILRVVQKSRCDSVPSIWVCRSFRFSLAPKPHRTASLTNWWSGMNWKKRFGRMLFRIIFESLNNLFEFRRTCKCAFEIGHTEAKHAYEFLSGLSVLASETWIFDSRVFAVNSFDLFWKYISALSLWHMSWLHRHFVYYGLWSLTQSYRFLKSGDVGCPHWLSLRKYEYVNCQVRTRCSILATMAFCDSRYKNSCTNRRQTC